MLALQTPETWKFLPAFLVDSPSKKQVNIRNTQLRGEDTSENKWKFPKSWGYPQIPQLRSFHYKLVLKKHGDFGTHVQKPVLKVNTTLDDLIEGAYVQVQFLRLA